MRAVADNLKRWRAAGSALLLVALWLKLLVPAGWMPGTSLAQPVVICTGQGPMPVMMVMNHDREHRPADAPAKHGDQPCAFTALGAAALTSDLPVVAPLPPQTIDRPAAAHKVGAPGRGLAAPPPPSRAPPVRHA